ncbi:MAG: hypothetical protein DHS20C18_25850 [Saprospiraceae bacterium]|nr:MAG: hypothetical protein DHS20C18_25850 [Saprospiraceae bacterium]
MKSKYVVLILLGISLGLFSCRDIGYSSPNIVSPKYSTVSEVITIGIKPTEALKSRKAFLALDGKKVSDCQVIPFEFGEIEIVAFRPIDYTLRPNTSYTLKIETTLFDYFWHQNSKYEFSVLENQNFVDDQEMENLYEKLCAGDLGIQNLKEANESRLIGRFLTALIRKKAEDIDWVNNKYFGTEACKEAGNYDKIGHFKLPPESIRFISYNLKEENDAGNTFMPDYDINAFKNKLPWGFEITEGVHKDLTYWGHLDVDFFSSLSSTSYEIVSKSGKTGAKERVERLGYDLTLTDRTLRSNWEKINLYCREYPTSLGMQIEGEKRPVLARSLTYTNKNLIPNILSWMASFETLQFEGEYHRTVKGEEVSEKFTAFLDFKEKDDFLNTKFQIGSLDWKEIFDATNYFSLLEKKKLVLYEVMPNSQIVAGSNIMLTPLFIKNLVELAVKDDKIDYSIGSASIEGEIYTEIVIPVNDFFADVNCTNVQFTDGKGKYKIYFEEENWAPVMLEMWSREFQFVMNFNDFQSNIEKPEISWKIDQFNPSYKRMTLKEYANEIENN